MIRTLLYRPDTRTTTTGGNELIDVWQQSADTLIWVDLCEHDGAAEGELLQQRFGLHPLAIQDVQHPRHPPKFEAFGDHALIILKGLTPDTGEFEFRTIQLAMLVGARFLVTRHSGPSSSIDRLWNQLQQDCSTCARGSDAIALALARISVDRYINRLVALEPRLEAIEEEIVLRPNDQVLAELTGYKTDLRKFRRALLYHVQVFRALLQDPPAQIRPERVHEVRDVFEHQERASSLAALYFETASDLIDGYISLASHRLNNIMKVLTIVTAIFVPLSFLAGIYGMNFEYIPELQSRSGYFVLLGVMAAIATTLLVIFRKRRWL